MTGNAASDASVRPIEAPSEGSLADTAAFFMAIPPFSVFERIGNADDFVPLPDGWMIGVADVVGSTSAIAEGRYKAVNMAGASVISAVSNALKTLDFPYIFAGDGASFAVAPSEASKAAEALAATVAWVGQELGLTLRAGTATVRTLRDRGFDVRIARFAASRDACYAMFAGGGLGKAEEDLKAGRLPAPTAPLGMQPDLDGLSCRFQDLKSKHGVILSILVRPVVDSGDRRFATLLADVLAIADRGPDAGRPIPVFRPLFGVTLRSITMNGRLGRRRGEGRLASWLRTAAESVFVSVVLGLRLKLGRFSPERYLAEVVANTDFRKYDDGLMMTIDCATPVADEIERRLVAADADGVARFGLHRQGSAMVTCVVPSAIQANHVHFVDGAAGGYAMAARSLKTAQPLASTEGL